MQKNLLTKTLRANLIVSFNIVQLSSTISLLDPMTPHFFATSVESMRNSALTTSELAMHTGLFFYAKVLSAPIMISLRPHIRLGRQ